MSCNAFVPRAVQGSKITLRGEAGCSEPGLQPGDVILMVQQKDHEYFKRVNVSRMLLIQNFAAISSVWTHNWYAHEPNY